MDGRVQGARWRDLYRAVRSYSQSAFRPSGGHEGLESAGRKLDAAGEATSAAPMEIAPESDKKVEIF